MTNDVDISEDDILRLHPAVLEQLLRDHTTGRNIFWATPSYAHLGEGFAYGDPITPDHITGRYGRVIQPRAVKSAAEQTRRSKDMAEVFTPSWVCNAQNNLVDEAWFGRAGVFNTEHPDTRTWIPTPAPIAFPEGRTWRDYVREPRLEMACGEAPYLVIRYDTVTGQPISDLAHRIGLLDRKLRIVSENTSTSGEWLKAAKEALQATYGFEWQGDNLLLAREAVLFTFCDYYEDKFHRPVPERSLPGVAYVVSWNLWQMDGLRLVVPCSCDNVFEENLLGERTRVQCQACRKGLAYGHIGTRCRIRDWRYTGKNPDRQRPYFEIVNKPR